MSMTREVYEKRKARLNEHTATARKELEAIQSTLLTLQKESLNLDAEWRLADAQANATPGMWRQSLADPMMVAAAKVLSDAGHAAAPIGGDNVGYCRGTGFYLPIRRRGEDVVAVWHLVDGRDRQPNGQDAWYEQLNSYREAFRAAGWRIEWHINGNQAVYASPPVDRTTEK